MRNYWISISLHIAILLLMIYPFLPNRSQNLDLERLVYLDFSDRRQEKAPSDAKRQLKEKVTQKSESSHEKSVAVPTNKKKPVETSRTKLPEQKASSAKVFRVEEESPFVKKQTQQKSTDEQLEAEMIRKAQAEKKEEQVKNFTRLLDEALESENSTKVNKETEADAGKTGSSSGASGASNISGSLGNRQVLKTPVIKDESQKYGRVVVKICVDGKGHVISSEYTQIGSTTSDQYLVRLAEKGASEYLFSTSPNQRECGKVVIDFRLK